MFEYHRLPSALSFRARARARVAQAEGERAPRPDSDSGLFHHVIPLKGRARGNGTGKLALGISDGINCED